MQKRGRRGASFFLPDADAPGTGAFGGMGKGGKAATVNLRHNFARIVEDKILSK
jgi:hypothetical protein